MRITLAGALLALCCTIHAQGFPGGGGPPGGHGGRPPPDGAQRPPPSQTAPPAEPLEQLLKTAIELRKSLMLDAAQLERWAEMQADLRDALDKRRAVMRRPADSTQVPNPALLFVQDMASAEGALGSALDKLAKSMQAAFDMLDERQRKTFVDKTNAALNPDGLR